MASFKVSEVAKKAEISVGDALDRLKSAGVKVNSGEDIVQEEEVAAAGLDSKYFQVDRRQEMLKKALERHKRGVKIKEVVVGKGNMSAAEANRSRKISKEDLIKKRSDLDQQLQKMDKEREGMRKRVEVEHKTPVKTVTVETAPAKEETRVVPVKENVQVKHREQQHVKRIDQPRQPSSNQGQSKPSRTEGEGRIHSQPYRQDNKERQSQNQGNRRSYEGGNRSSSGSGFQRSSQSGGDSRQRVGESNRQYAQQRPYGDRKQSGGQNRYGDRPYRPNADRPGGGHYSSSKPSDDTGLSLTLEEERKRIVKKKEDDAAKEKEARKPKTKKDGKKLKSWAKTITEGIDELNIEREIEVPLTISPNIDISDLADVDTDRKPKDSSNYKSRFERKARRKTDTKAVQKAFVRPEQVEIGERVVISDFGSLIGIKAAELIKKLFGMGIMATVNQSVDAETAQLLGIEYGVDVIVKTVTEDDLLPTYEDSSEDLEKRPPIVTVMGHVDHGKTSLLDAIRSTSVVAGEAGGITQHIGAYEVESASGKIIFLDTPGHEAFTTLRARGALLTDIVILVVAADDGVKPQTKEAIDHAKAAGVRIVVAINKIDKDGANPDRVRQQLAEYGIIPEDWGGEYQFQEISAKKRIGIDDLLERVLLEAEVLDLKGNPNRDAEGIVIEARLDKQKGPVATILVKNGTLKKGDSFISGSQFGKVRAMFNFKGIPIKDAGVSIPVEVMGFSEVPEAGEKFIVADEKTIKQVVDLRLNVLREKQRAEKGKQLSLTDVFSQIKEGQLKELNIVLKADAQGSVEALANSLLKLSNQEVKVNIIHDGIGAITESDVSLANASKAIIIGFNVRPDSNARQVADKEGVSIELYSIIYKAIDDVKLALEGLLSSEMKENIIGKVEIRQVFSVPKIGKIAGCFVLEGKVVRNSQVRLIRDSIVIFDGKISSLKRFTDDAKEVVAGYECGLSIDKYQDIKEGDTLEVYEVIEEKRTLEDVAKAEREQAEKNK